MWILTSSYWTRISPAILLQFLHDSIATGQLGSEHNGTIFCHMCAFWLVAWKNSLVNIWGTISSKSLFLNKVYLVGCIFHSKFQSSKWDNCMWMNLQSRWCMLLHSDRGRLHRGLENKQSKGKSSTTGQPWASDATILGIFTKLSSKNVFWPRLILKTWSCLSDMAEEFNMALCAFQYMEESWCAENNPF